MELTKLKAGWALAWNIEEIIIQKGMVLNADEIVMRRRARVLRWEETEESFDLEKGIGPRIKAFIVGILEEKERELRKKLNEL